MNIQVVGINVPPEAPQPNLRPSRRSFFNTHAWMKLGDLVYDPTVGPYTAYAFPAYIGDLLDRTTVAEQRVSPLPPQLKRLSFRLR